MRKFFLATLLVSTILPLSSAYSADSLMKTLSASVPKNEANQSIDEKLKSFSDKFKSLAVSEGIAGETEACQTVCSASCSWVNGVCQVTTTCSLQCGF
ncbi:hypothetical protein GGE50_006401 [Rhizobium leguminosarum]|uniref:hypothetical protein n=1 Tax=Rhizobium leguminosarum TaxID=384 RepID=UPI00161D65A3|nr:hypothetical protein [Rhizobium leguminosarum]MBB4590469.1 hypothetical protein [Rhizobium leguminosarum]